MSDDAPDQQTALREALKRTAVALKSGDFPFALAGGYAAWARGAPEPSHDVDFVVPADDAGRAAEHLRACGLRVDEPAEDWLFKVYTDDSMVDVTFRAAGEAVSREQLQDVDVLEVLSVEMPVLSATAVMISKLAALDEHYCDFSALLPVARGLREQVDWPRLRERLHDNDFAMVFLDLLVRLGIVDGDAVRAHGREAAG
jgi:hypothetical protein